MKIRKILLLLFPMMVVAIVSCNNDDDGTSTTPPRDRQEVYDEDKVEIDDFLATHYYNYEDFDFDNPYSEANDSFRIVFDTIIPGETDDKIPLIDRPELKFKMVEDSEGIEYKLYYLDVREGAGNVVHFTDRVQVIYEGSTIPSDDVFEEIVNEAPLSLISVGSDYGIVQGLASAFTEFKTSTSFTSNGDGTVQYHGHGIGAVFIPSGLGYFNQTTANFSSYTPLIFKFYLMERTVLDHDLDGIPSYLEDIDGNLNAYDDDTDGDLAPNFVDNDDDGDLVLTIDEVDFPEPYTITLGDPDPVFAENEYEISREVNGTVVTIKTVVLTDTNDDGIPDYLDPDTAIED